MSSPEIQQLKAKIDQLNERLENNRVYKPDAEGNLVREDREPGTVPDGITCRDETIRGLEEQIARLEKKNLELELIRPFNMVGVALDRARTDYREAFGTEEIPDGRFAHWLIQRAELAEKRNKALNKVCVSNMQHTLDSVQELEGLKYWAQLLGEALRAGSLSLESGEDLHEVTAAFNERSEAEELLYLLKEASQQEPLDDDLEQSCRRMLRIVFSHNASTEEKERARSTLLEAIAPQEKTDTGDDSRVYEIELAEQQWEELLSIGLGLEPVGLKAGQALTRSTWFLLAQLLLGKAQLIDDGRYNMGDDDDGFDPAAWAAELREIAHVILREFRPGDGKL